MIRFKRGSPICDLYMTIQNSVGDWLYDDYLTLLILMDYHIHLYNKYGIVHFVFMGLLVKIFIK